MAHSFVTCELTAPVRFLRQVSLHRQRAPSIAKHFLNFMQFLGNFGKTGWLAPPLMGNPGSALDRVLF